jgi:hypothetical protein
MRLGIRRKRDGDEWRFTAFYRLGQHWQEHGDFERAHAAYLKARELQPEHRRTLYGLTVVQIRLGLYDAAWETLDVLSDAEELEREFDADGEWRPCQFPIAYQRALILEYRSDHDHGAASMWSEPLAERSLEGGGPRGDVAPEPLRLPALVLHVGIVVERDYETLPAQVTEELLQLLDRDKPAAPEPPAAGEPRPSVDDPSAIIAYVLSRPRAGPRTQYNVACFLSRLAHHVPAKADALAPHIVRAAEIAIQDAHLASWAMDDPSLRPVHHRPEWATIAKRIEPEPEASQAPQKPAAPPPEPEPPPIVMHGRKEVLGHARNLMKEVYVGPSAAEALEAIARLRERAGELDERAFQIELASAVAAAGDPCTVYWLPGDPAPAGMALPFRLEEVADEAGGSRFVVRDSVGGPHDDGVVTHWNRVPIERAVEVRAARIAGASREARRARALMTLTHRPAGLLAPFAEGDVELRLLGEPPRELMVGWEPSVMSEADEETALWSLDPVVDAVARMRHLPTAIGHDRKAGGVVHLRIPSFRVSEEALAEALGKGLDRSDGVRGVVVDLRGNPGGSTEAAFFLLAALTGETVLWQLRSDPPGDAAGSRVEPTGERMQGIVHPPAGELEPYAKASRLVLVDALTAGAAANLTLEFARRERGVVASTVRNPGLLGGIMGTVGGPGRFTVRFARFAGVDDTSPQLRVLAPGRTGDDAVLIEAEKIVRGS